MRVPARRSYMLDGRHCIRPSADEALLLDEQFIQLAPLLSPVLPVNIPDNEVTKHLAGETRMASTIALIVKARRAWPPVTSLMTSHGLP